MATQTSKLGLIMPDYGDFQDVEVLNDNFKKIDDFAQKGATLSETATGTELMLDDTSDNYLRGLTIYGKSTQDGTPTPDTPVDIVNVGAEGEVNVEVTGANMLGGDALSDVIVRDFSGTKDDPVGTVSFNAAKASGKTLLDTFKPDTQYTIILYGYNSQSSNITNLYVLYTDGTHGRLEFPSTTGGYCVLTTLAGKSVQAVNGSYNSGRTYLYYDKCGIFEGVVSLEDFQPYTGQTLTLATPTGLCGLGDVRDEVDFARGKLIRRIGQVDLGTLSWSKNTDYQFYATLPAKAKTPYVTNHLCTAYVASAQGAYNNTENKAISLSTERAWIRDTSYTTASALKSALSGAMLLYEVATPTETDLTAEEIQAYKVLHTNYPTTAISNDSNAEMEVTYLTGAVQELGIKEMQDLINSPEMLVGKEYETNEMWLGKQVYSVILDGLDEPDCVQGGYTQSEITLPSHIKPKAIVRRQAWLHEYDDISDVVHHLPYNTHEGFINVEFVKQNGYVTKARLFSFSNPIGMGYKGAIQIWYIKD